MLFFSCVALIIFFASLFYVLEGAALVVVGLYYVPVAFLSDVGLALSQGGAANTKRSSRDSAVLVGRHGPTSLGIPLALVTTTKYKGRYSFNKMG